MCSRIRKPKRAYAAVMAGLTDLAAAVKRIFAGQSYAEAEARFEGGEIE